MTEALQRLCAEAAVLAGGEHPCEVLGHKWRTTGGRACPRGKTDDFSQAVYVCDVPGCHAIDYGEPGGPGHRDCYEDGPCDPACELEALG